MIKIYTASKLKHAKMWRDLCQANSSFIFHARWLKHNAIGTPDTPGHAAEFWRQDVQDVIQSDAVMVYSENNEPLRGALVEAGVAIANGIPVYVIGDSNSYGTWQYHSGVSRVPSLSDFIHYVVPTIKPRS